MKNLKIKLAIGIVTLAMLASFFVPSAISVVKAAELTSKETQIIQALVVPSMPNSVLEEAQTYDIDEVAEYAKEFAVMTNEDELIISDLQMARIMEEMGTEIPLRAKLAMSRGAGVTRFVRLGNGSWDIYLSRFTIQVYTYSAGLLVGVLVAWLGAPNVAKKIVGIAFTIARMYLSHGVWLRIRNWNINSYGKQ